MNPYTLDFSENKMNILDALIEVYGDDYSKLITERFNLIYFTPYVNYEGINSYYRFLIGCKSRELSLKMLNVVGVNVDKYNVSNYADEFNEELKNICEKLIGGSYSFEPLFSDTPYGFRSFISKYNTGYSDDYIIEQKILFINELKNDDFGIVTCDNYEEFTKTDEYKRIEAIAIYYSGVYDSLLYTMNKYIETIKEYNDFYKKELERKRALFEKKRIELFKTLKRGLRGRIKDYINSLDSEEEQAKALLSSNVEYTSDIEYFADEYESKINDPNVEEHNKKWIYSCRMKFFKSMGLDINPWGDNYNEVIQREDVKSLIVYSVFANEITRLRKLYLEEAQKEFILTSKEYKDACGYFADNEGNRNAIYTIMSKLQVCVNGGHNQDLKFIPLVYYTIRGWQCGCMDYVLLHEIVHAIECVSLNNMEHGCGFEPNIDNPEYSTKDHHDKKRKYERLNEVMTDFLAIEVCEVLHKKDIYLLDDKLLTLTDIDNFNTSKTLKDLLRRFYRKYRKYILEARLKGDLTCLTDYIGEDNFEELNDIIDTIDVLIEKGLSDKLRDNKDDDPLVIEYNNLRNRLKEVYRCMDDTFEYRMNSYSGYWYKKRRFK